MSGKISREEAEKKLDENCGMTTRQVTLLMAGTAKKTAEALCQIARYQAKLLKDQHEKEGIIEPPYVSLEFFCKIVEEQFK